MDAAKKEHDEIEDKYNKKEEAMDAAKAAWQAKADADAKALAATRAATQAKFEAQAAADQADYEKKMAHAAELQADADKAQGAYEDDVAAGEHEQEEADAMTKAELGYGNEIEECATGTQCLDATDMKCKDLGTTFCIAEDQFSCAPVPASGHCNEFGAAPGAGLATYNVAPALTVAPIPHPSKACISHIKGAGDAIPGGILSEIMQWDPEHEELPMVKFFCGHDDLPGATVKAAFEYFMKALELCPMYCVPGSAETVKSTDGKEDLPINHGTCLTNADAAAFGDEVQKLPIYKVQGTNDRFDAANNLNDKICSRAKMFEEGWKGGQDTSLIQKEADLNEEGHQASIDESSAKAENNEKKAEKAAEKEEEWTAKEAKRTARAAKLAKKQVELRAKAEADNAKANADAAAYMADVVAKSEAAAKASADADAANNDLEAAHADLAKAKKDNEEKLAEIAKNYNDEVAALDAKHKEDEAAFAAEEKEHAAAVAEELKQNGLNAEAAKKEIEKEAEDNKAAAKKEHDETEDKYNKKEEAMDAAKAAWQAKADADAKALAATRAATQAKFEAQAAADQADYEKKMAHAAARQADADKAQGAYEDDVAAGEHEQEEADAMTKAELGYGNEIEECATGTQCLDATSMTCKEVPADFCIADDQWSCAPKPASGEFAEFGAAAGQGLDNYDVAPALTVAPQPAPTKACIDHIKGAKTAVPGAILKDIVAWDPTKEELPMEKFFCDHKSLPGAQIKSAFEYFMTALEICPMYCVPGTAKTVKATDGTTDLPVSLGLCLTNADASQFKQQITHLPIYKAQGTNDRFDPANNLADKMCSYATTFTEGWKKGAEEPKKA